MTTAQTDNDPHPPRHDVQFWEPRRVLTLDAARRHSVIVFQTRRVLMVLAGLLVLVLFWFFIKAPTTIIPTDNPDEAVKMVNPVYRGQTSDNLPYRITADAAIRLLRSPDEMKLTNPVLNFLRNDAAGQSVILALSGAYNVETEVLELSQEVNLKTDDGYACTTNHARILVKDKRIEGDQSINCTGDFGQAEGNAYEINDGYSEFVFKNGMSAQLVARKASEVMSAPHGTAPDEDITKDNNNANNSPLKLSFGGDEPIDVKADRAVYKGPKTTLSGNVLIIQGSSKIYADRMDMFREELVDADGKMVGYGNINKIVALDNFKYETPENAVLGEKGVYERDKDIITVTGNVEFTQENSNSVSGNKMVYDLTANRVSFGGDCLGRNCKPNGRVNIRVGQ